MLAACRKTLDWLVPYRAGTGFWWRPPVASSNDVVRIARRGILHDLSRWDQIREIARFVHLLDIAERINAIHHKIRQFEIRILAFLLTLAFCGRAHAGPPLEVVRTTVDRVIQILKDPNLSTPDKGRERFNSVTVALEGVFDYERWPGEPSVRIGGKEPRQSRMSLLNCSELSCKQSTRIRSGSMAAKGRALDVRSWITTLRRLKQRLFGPG